MNYIELYFRYRKLNLTPSAAMRWAIADSFPSTNHKVIS